MSLTRWVPLLLCSVLLSGCGKSSKLAAFLPDAPEGWAVDGGSTRSDISGVGHSSSRSYVPVGNNAATGVKRVAVQNIAGRKRR